MLVLEKKYDIIGISETWMTADNSDEEMGITGYTLHRQDRNDPVKKKGGGVALYISNELDCVRREELYNQDFPESIWCSINCNGSSTLVGVCYRAPDSEDKNDIALYSIIEKPSKEELVIM